MSSFRKPICSAGRRRVITTKAPRHQGILGALVPWWFKILRISLERNLHEAEQRALCRRIGEWRDRLTCLLAIVDRGLLRIEQSTILRHELAYDAGALLRFLSLADHFQ